MESEDSLDFVIDTAQSAFVKAAGNRINYLFHVNVEFEKIFEGSSQSKQWIKVIGLKTEIERTKEYILALTSPAETIRVKNIWENPLFTSKKDEIERACCAVLSKCDDDDSLVISGTEYSVILAQSMIDDLLSKTHDNATDKKPDSNGDRNTNQDYGSEVYCVDLCCSEKESGVLAGSVHTNKNNSSLTSLLPNSLLNPSLAGANYSDGFLKSDPKPSFHPGITSSPHKGITLSSPHSTYGLLGSSTCSSSVGKGLCTENGADWQPVAHVKACHSNDEKDKMVTVPPSAERTRPFSNELPGSSNSTYASALTIPPMFGSLALSSGAGTIQTRAVPHMVNHAGDGWSTKNIPTDPQCARQFGFGDVPVDFCNIDPSPKAASNSSSPQSVSQQAYLRNLGLSLHYSSEDVENGLACYDMDNIIKPAEFLYTLNRIKTQRHGGGYWKTAAAGGEVPCFSHISSASTVPDSTAEIAADKVPSDMADDDCDVMDASVICMGSTGGNGTIILSSDDEGQEAGYYDQARVFPEERHVIRRVVSDHQNRNSLDTEDFAIYQEQTGNKNLRYIIIDGSNVAMAHGNDKIFSVEGLRICINYFVKRGHDRITAFVPEWRRYSENQKLITRRSLLEKLHDDGYVKFTPARRVGGRTIASYDDRFILNLAEKEDGIVVSNDQFRDLCQENPNYRKIVENQLLQFMFVGNHFMPPDDPLGRYGPHLDDFLQCHQQSRIMANGYREETQNLGEAERLTVNLKPSFRGHPKHKRNLLIRSETITAELQEKLTQLFPEPRQLLVVQNVLKNHKRETDLNRLTNYCMNAM